MRVTMLFFAGCLMLSAVDSALGNEGAVRFQVPLDNLGIRSEPGSGHAEITLAEGRGEVEVEGLRLVPHDDPLGAGRIMGYAAWLVNSENALGKINLGFLFPDAQGKARLNFNIADSRRTNLGSQGFNMVVITLEAELDLARPQPSGPPIIAGHIPGTPTPVTPPPAAEVFMGKLTDDVFGFQPETVIIFSGQTIRWTNVSPEYVIPHTATRTEAFDGTTFGPGQEFDSGPVPFGQSFSRTFTLPAGVPAGVFNYHCIPHAELAPLGMTGRIVVVAQPTFCTATLTGAEEVPPVTTAATGSATLELNPTLGTLTYTVTTSGLSGVAAHIHEAPAGVNGPIIFGLEGGPTTWSGKTAPLSAEQVTTLKSGGFYVNVHTAANPGGEIRGQIQCQ